MDKYKSTELSLFILSQFLIVIILLFALFPMYYLFVSVFKTAEDFAANQFGIPTRLTVRNVATAWIQGKFSRAFGSSMIVAITATFIRILLGSLAGYAFAKMEFTGKRYLYYIFIVSMFIPIIMLIIPLYIVLSRLHLLNTYIGTIIIFSGTGSMGFTAYVFTNFFCGLPSALFDAAKVDGCTGFKFYYKILLPLSKPIISTLSIINFLWIWNNLLIPLVFLNVESKWTLMVRITSFRGRYYTDLTVLMAGLFIATLPMILLYTFAQKQFVRGMLLGTER